MEQFGKYQLVRRIGAGGMAEVFLARTAVAQGLSKELVIKKIHPDYARSQRFVSMFVAEAGIALGLNHPNIVQVFDFGRVDGTFFLAMEHIDGLDLVRLLAATQQAGRPLSLELAAFIVQETARGLDYAHRKTDAFGTPLAIVHRDVSPQNVLVSWDGGVKLVDFGVARARGMDESAGVVKGKYHYMAPEQARGESVDRRADVFSTGVVLFELCCGRPLFSGPSHEALAQVKAGAIVRPRDINPDIPATLEAAILKALAFHPDDRFQSARDLQSALGRFLLERARDTGRLIDESALAQFLAEIHPHGRRMPAPESDLAQGTDVVVLPRAVAQAPSLQSAQPAPASRPPDEISQLDIPIPGMPVGAEPETRERKHVLVVAGRLQRTPQGDTGGTGDGPGRPAPDAGADTGDLDIGFNLALASTLPLSTGSAAETGRLRWDADWARTLRDIAFKHHARVHTVDEQGFVLVLGVPVSAEDDPEHAIQMALALVDAADALGRERGVSQRLAVGIQRGIAVLRRRHDPARPGAGPGAGTGAGTAAGPGTAPGASIGPGGDAAITSDDVELAAWTVDVACQLAGRADGGEILVSGGVQQVTRTDWRFAEAGWAVFPGGDAGTAPGQQARVYRLLGPKDRAERLRDHRAQQGDPIGRELELRALRDAYRDVQVRRAKRYILLAGDIGVGKHALVNALVRSLPRGEAVVLRAVTRVATAYTPYAVIADMARDLLAVDESAPDAVVRERVARVIHLLYPDPTEAREADRVVAILHRLLTGTAEAPELPPEPAPAPRGAPAGSDGGALDVDESRERVWQAIARLEQRMAPDKPLVVLVEDAHWCDDESLAMLRRLFTLPTNRPMLGLMTSRPDARVARVAATIRADILRVDALDPESAMALVTRRFVPDADAGELARQIVARTGGNPYFIREVLDSLRERGVVIEEVTDTGARLLRWVDHAAPLGVPSSVEAFLAARIDALPPDEKQALLSAAVLGRSCRPEALGHLLERSPEPELAALVQRGLLVVREGRHTFPNDMLMSVAYGLLAPEERTRLHRRAAAHLAEAPRYREGQDDAVIARHLELAGDAVAAADRYTRAATHAAGVGGNGDALRQLGRALKLLPADEHARRFQAHAQREEILSRLVRKPEQLREIQSMLRAAQALADPGRLAQAHVQLAAFHLLAGNTAAAARAAGQALEHARQAGAPLAEAEALRLRAVIAQRTGHAAESLEIVQGALALCDDGSAGLEQRASILLVRGTTLWHMSRLEEAIESYAEALVIYRHLHRPRQEAQALNSMANIFAAMGEFEEALAHYKRSLKLDQQLGDRGAVATKLGNIGQTYADVGDVARAERYLRRGLALADELGDSATSTDAAISLGQIALILGRHLEAITLLERGLALARQGDDRYMEIRARIYLAWADLDAGHDPANALDLARTATELAADMPMPVGQTFGLAVQALALAALGRAAQAAEASAQAVRLQAAMERPEGAEQILYVHAVLCEAAGRLDEAVQAIRQARREVEAKASRLRDGALRTLYLASRIPASIDAVHDRLITTVTP
jgi:serine/threonine protein kinase/tetratricopeptide (TPR) repeat protein